jgi:hypothetical protein
MKNNPILKQEATERARARARTLSNSVQEGAPVGLPPVKKRTAFQRKYWSDPAGFARDCIKWGYDEGLTFYQNECMELLIQKGRLAVRGPHGLGKSTSAAILILWFALTRDGEDWKVPTTASAWRQLIKYLWPEVHKWSRRLRWDVIGREPFKMNVELQGTSLKLETGEAFALASNQAELIEGAHADHMLFIFDEAKAIDIPTWDAAEGAFMSSDKHEAFALAISTPGEPVGRFYDIHRRLPGYEDWHVRHVKLEETIQAGRISAEKAVQRKRQWGEKSAVYQNRVLGEFCASDEDGIIPLAWIEAANERWRVWRAAGRPGQLIAVGGDIARSADGDKNVIARRYQVNLPEIVGTEGNIVSPAVREALAENQKFNEIDTMSTAGKIKGAMSINPAAVGVIDVIGYGAGTVDRLREQGLKIIAFHANGRAETVENGKRVMIRDKSGEFEFSNMRSAAWWHLRELLDPFNNEHVAIPEDDILTGDLTAPHWKVNSAGRIEIEGKDDGWPDSQGNPRPSLKNRLGRSTDDGDAVVMALTPKGWFDDDAIPHSYLVLSSAQGWGFTQRRHSSVRG